VKTDIWFCHVAECTGDLTVSLCDSTYDTKLAVYPDCDCPPAQVPVACNDDSPDCSPNGLSSFAQIPVVEGDPYSIRVGGWLGLSGQGELSIRCVECENDQDCEDGNLCTHNACSGGRCSLTYDDCDDGNPCTIDDCNPTEGCVTDPVRCDANDACLIGECVPATGVCDFTEVTCDDADPCTADACDPELGCSNTFIDCDGDTVCDAEDNCRTVPNADQANGDGDFYGDVCDGPFDTDHDGDVDAVDYTEFWLCTSVPGPAPPGCLADHDANGDQQLDLHDYGSLQVRFTGSRTSPCD
jgi:hypothetical protein